MSDPASPQVSGTQGGVHAGTGDQYIYHPMSLTDSKGRSPRTQATDELRWLAQRFVHPAGFGRAREVLELYRTVFLDAPPGSGRITAAKVLLWELRADTEKFHELLLQENEPRLNLGHIGDGDRVWLDLSSVDRPLWSEIHAELSSLRRSVHEHAADLVVVLPHETEDLRPEFDQYRVQIECPPVHEVLCRYLLMEDIPPPVPLPPLQFLAGNRPLREIQKYVRLITEARGKASGLGDFATWCDTAYQAMSGQEKKVADRVTALRQGSQRALLLATAMLHGAHADIIVVAGDSLLRAVEHPLDECPMLERTTLDRRLGDIHAELDAAGSIWFEELDYDSAVRAYFWTHMPELHDRIGAWVGTTADSEGLTDDERDGLVRRFAEQCLNERYRSILVSLVPQWTADATTSGGMKAAALVLQCGLREEEHGRTFRRQIYGWSRSSNLSARLAEVIVVACRDEMAVSHPDEALVRLHHVARRERGTRAREALVGLVRGDRRFLRQMLNRLTDTNPETRKWPADVALFLDLADPEALIDRGLRNHALIAESAVRRQLTDGWSLVFAKPSFETWSPRVRQWLLLAAEDERHQHVLLDVLVGAGEQRTDVLARLYAMTRGQELRAIISDLLLQKINAAQGVPSA